MGKKTVFLGHSDLFWRKVWKYRQEGISWYKIGRLTGFDGGWFAKRKVEIEHHLVKYTTDTAFLKNKGKTKLILSTATIKIIRMAARAGYSEQEIADLCEISMSTLQRYKRQKPELAKVIRQGKKLAVLEVVDGLQKKAAGFKIKETKLAQHEGVFTDAVDVDKYFPPSEKAAELYLVNKSDWKPTRGGNDTQNNPIDTKGKILKWIDAIKKPLPEEEVENDSVEKRDSSTESNTDNTEES